MKKCTGCDGQGFIESSVMRDARTYPSISQCPKCKNVAAYSRRVQEARGFAAPTVMAQAPTNVLAFPSRTRAT